MFERGIHTTKADWQFHYCPKDRSFYYYNVTDARNWIERISPHRVE
ncbi:unnamed protein product, partial [marine sediment metagenome]